MEVKQEYERLREIFADGTNEKLLAAADGTLWEAARLRVQLDELNETVKKTGLVMTIEIDGQIVQKARPVARVLTQVRANYLNYISRLGKMLGGGSVEEFEDDFSDYE